MSEETSNVSISYAVRVTPGKTGVDHEAADWEVCELEDGEIKNNADIYDHLTFAEANQMADMWTKKKEEAEAS